VGGGHNILFAGGEKGLEQDCKFHGRSQQQNKTLGRPTPQELKCSYTARKVTEVSFTQNKGEENNVGAHKGTPIRTAHNT